MGQHSKFTYMRQSAGRFRYNCTIIDLYDRAVIASINGDNINTELAVAALTEALDTQKHSKGLILHSDQGVQFASYDFVNFFKEHGITQSMSKAGCPYDNAPMERYYNTFKNCFYYRFTFESTEMPDEMTKSYVNWYNYVRPHSYNNYMTPIEAHFSWNISDQSVTKNIDQYRLYFRGHTDCISYLKKVGALN